MIWNYKTHEAMVSEWSTSVPGSKELTTGRGSTVKSTDDTPET